MKNFFKTYLTDYGYLIGNFGLVTIIAFFISHFISFPNAISFFIWCMIFSPCAYYFSEYKSQLRKTYTDIVNKDLLPVLKSMADELDRKTSRFGS